MSSSAVDMFLRRFSRAGGKPASIFSAVISSSKRKRATRVLWGDRNLHGLRRWQHPTPLRLFSRVIRTSLENSVRPDGAVYQWRKVPPSEMSVALVADERFGGATYRA